MNQSIPTQPVQLAYILMEGIETDIEIGIEPSEHGRIQRLVIDVEVGFNDQQTRIPDSPEGLKQGFDYSAIRNSVLDATHTKTYLLETIANRIADSVLAMPNALTCSVKVSKGRCWANVELTSIKIFRTTRTAI